jgi:hypothetical protein
VPQGLGCSAAAAAEAEEVAAAANQHKRAKCTPYITLTEMVGQEHYVLKPFF